MGEIVQLGNTEGQFQLNKGGDKILQLFIQNTLCFIMKIVETSIFCRFSIFELLNHTKKIRPNDTFQTAWLNIGKNKENIIKSLMRFFWLENDM